MDLFLLPVFASASLQPHRVRREPPIRSRKLRGVRKRNWAGALSFCCPGTSTSKNVATLSLGVQLRTAKNKKAKPVITNEETWAVSWNTLMLKKWNPREGNEPRSRKGPGSSVSHWALSFICPSIYCYLHKCGPFWKVQPRGCLQAPTNAKYFARHSWKLKKKKNYKQSWISFICFLYKNIHIIYFKSRTW